MWVCSFTRFYVIFRCFLFISHTATVEEFLYERKALINKLNSAIQLMRMSVGKEIVGFCSNKNFLLEKCKILWISVNIAFFENVGNCSAYCIELNHRSSQQKQINKEKMLQRMLAFDSFQFSGSSFGVCELFVVIRLSLSVPVPAPQDNKYRLALFSHQRVYRLDGK